MAESGVGACPQVFVVDSQANYVPVPSERKSRWTRAGQKFFLLLVGLTLFGLLVQGCLIYNLYKKLEALALYESPPNFQNLSSPKASAQQGGNIMTQVGHRGSNEIPVQPLPKQVQQRPFAQLLGSSHPAGENNVVQWVHKGGETVIQNMDYNNGRLLVEKEGYYYLYSKVTVNAAMECVLIQHKVMKDTKAYDEPIQLMRSKSFQCKPWKPSSTKASGVEDIWNSFLGGIFHLLSGDEIFVTLEDIQTMRTGTADNFMGAFMIFP
ncbi:tumor necrosis factor ligand superfamily member 14-like [Pempheris klunzingeri]|uniref:tumor necrosis factor ligand superfamily member 14-like n=1 Tax=Pempheris klunzingeri TaxID=3127111 RepID=UPI003980092F